MNDPPAGRSVPMRDDPVRGSSSNEGAGGRRETDPGALVMLDATTRSAFARQAGHGEGAVLPVAGADRVAILVGLPGEDALVIDGAEAHVLPRGAGGAELGERAIAAAAAWRRERQRLERRVRSADWLMLFIDELGAIRAGDDVYRATLACATRVTGVFASLVYVRDARAADGPVRTIHDPDRPNAVASLADIPAGAHGELLVVSEVEAGAGDRACRMLAPLFPAFGAAQLLCAPVGSDALLVLVERRRDRLFTADERDAVRWIVRQAERALAAGASR